MSPTQWKEIAEVAEAALTSVGIVVGAVWTYVLFVRNRQRYPRANISQSISDLPLSPSMQLLHVTVRMENVGATLIKLASGHIRVQQILPLGDDVTEAVRCGRDPVDAGGCEVSWPLIAERLCPWEAEPREIEPNEADEFHFDFVIPTTATTIVVYSYLKNVVKREREIGWNKTSLYNLAGRVENMSDRKIQAPPKAPPPPPPKKK